MMQTSNQLEQRVALHINRSFKLRRVSSLRQKTISNLNKSLFDNLLALSCNNLRRTTNYRYFLMSTMEISSYSSRQRDEELFNLKDWAFKAQMISRENSYSRRFSASHIRSSREEARSFRSNITISSTASSPGYTLRDEIDPSKYCFSTALQALQARPGYGSWGCLSPEGFALNSKWNEAEKYICNPLSGEFPVECLSAKTLSGRSFHKLTHRTTISAPLVYSSRNIQIKPSFAQEDTCLPPPIAEKEILEGMTRDVGTQSTPPYPSPSSPSRSSTPPITDSSNSKMQSAEKVEVKKTGEAVLEETERVKEEHKFRRGRCFSWMRCKRLMRQKR